MFTPMDREKFTPKSFALSSAVLDSARSGAPDVIWQASAHPRMHEKSTIKPGEEAIAIPK